MSDHDLCQELLPWYGNGSLNEKEMALCEAHIEVCEACRDDFEETMVQMRGLNAQPHKTLDADAGFQALRSHVRASQTTRADYRWPASLAATVVLTIALTFTVVTPDAGYELLTDPVVDPHTYVQLAFHPGTPEEAVRAFIRGSGGTVTGNPTAAGIYRLRFSEDVPAATLKALRNHATVAWANVEL